MNRIQKILLLAITFFLLTESTVGAAGQPQVYFEPTPLTLTNVGDSGRVDVKISGATNISGYEFHIDFNSQAIRVDGVEVLDPPTGVGVIPLGPEIDNGIGSIAVGTLNYTGEDILTGATAALVRINLTTLKAGTSTLSFTDALLTDTNYRTVTVTTTDGLVQTGVAPTPTLTPTPTPTSIPTPTPTPGPVGCWDLCLFDFQCPSGLDCRWVSWVRRCANPSCPSERDCICPIPTPTPTPAPTLTISPTPTPTLTLTPTPTPTPTPSPAPTPTPTPTRTLTPTPTLVPLVGLKLDLLKVWFQKQDISLGSGHKGAALLYLKSGGTVVLKKAVLLDGNGEARNVELPGVGSGTYNALIYQAGYLTKKLTNVEIREGGNSLDFTRGETEYFLVGDFNGDQIVNIMDFSILIKNYNKRGEE